MFKKSSELNLVRILNQMKGIQLAKKNLIDIALPFCLTNN